MQSISDAIVTHAIPFVGIDENGSISPAIRVEHVGRGLRDYLGSLEPAHPSPSRPVVAGIGSWTNSRLLEWMPDW